MPKAPRSQEDIDFIRGRILDEALAIISEQGFKQFSMRKLASRLGLTATTIYNYYSSKDELYLMILTKGFDELAQSLEKIDRTVPVPRDKIRDMIRAYVDYGIGNSHYYNIMFTSDAPKYRDYVGTTIEPVASFEKSTALKLIDITSGMVRGILRKSGIPDETIRYSILRLWTSLHGIIALYNSRVLHEVEDDPSTTVEHMVNDLITSFQDLFARRESLQENRKNKRMPVG